jgi:hypothetical protein
MIAKLNISTRRRLPKCGRGEVLALGVVFSPAIFSLFLVLVNALFLSASKIKGIILTFRSKSYV